MRAGRLITHMEVRVLAPLVNTEGTSRVSDVEEREVVANPRVGLLAAGNKVHGVCRCESKGLVLGQEEVLALVHVDILVSSGDNATHDRFFSRGLTGDEVVVSIVGDVIGATGSVNLEEVNAAAVGKNTNAQVVAANRAGPVGDTVSVDLATKHTNGRRVNVVRGDGDGIPLIWNSMSSVAGRNCCNSDNGQGHSKKWNPLV